MGMWFQIALWKRILGSMIIGVIVGVAWGEGVVAIAWIGELFIRLIRMVVVPLVFVTLVSGLISMGDPSSELPDRVVFFNGLYKMVHKSFCRNKHNFLFRFNFQTYSIEQMCFSHSNTAI